LSYDNHKALKLVALVKLMGYLMISEYKHIWVSQYLWNEHG